MPDAQPGAAGAKIRAHAEAQGIPLTTDPPYVDIDVSGGKMKRRGLDAAMEGVRDGRYGGIIVARLNRFARSTLGGVRVEKQIRQLGGVLVPVDFRVDTTNATGRKMLRDWLSMYEYELDALREQSSELHDLKIEQECVLIAGRPPTGYDWAVIGKKKDGRPVHGPLVLNAHAPAVKKAFEMRAARAAWADIARYLTEQGVPAYQRSKNAEGQRVRKPWSGESVRQIIENRAYLGEINHGGIEKVDEETGETYTTKLRVKRNAHPALVTHRIWEAANAVKGTRAAPRGDYTGSPMLMGLIKCGSCGGAMSRNYTTIKGKRTPSTSARATRPARRCTAAHLSPHRSWSRWWSRRRWSGSAASTSPWWTPHPARWILRRMRCSRSTPRKRSWRAHAAS